MILELLPMSFWYVISDILLCQSMDIYFKNNLAKFHPDPTWNDGT